MKPTTLSRLTTWLVAFCLLVYIGILIWLVSDSMANHVCPSVEPRKQDYHSVPSPRSYNV